MGAADLTHMNTLKTDSIIRPSKGQYVPPRLATGAYFFYLAGILLLGGLLVFPAFSIVSSGFGADIPFHRFFLRFLKLLALIGLPPLMISLGLHTRRRWGYGSDAHLFTVEFFIGLAIGTASILWVYLFLWVLGVRLPVAAAPFSASEWVSLATKALTTGLVVAVIEETWFRGALQGAISKTHSVMVAVVVTASLYGLVHFIRADGAPSSAPDWASGLAMLPALFSRLRNPAIIPDLLALTAAGVWLSLLRIHTGRISLAIGVHAGWVMVLKMGKKLTTANPESELGWLVGSYNGVIGWLAFAWFAVLAATCYWFYVRPERP